MTDPKTLLRIELPDTEPRVDVPSDRTVSGAPAFSIWNLERAADNTIASGIWETTPGAWRATYDGKWEFCTIIFGALTITEDGADPVTYRAGESFVVRDGFKGIWSAEEPTRKHYVVHIKPR